MKLFYAAATAMVIGLTSVSGHANGGDNKVVMDERSQVIKNTFGNCVRTKWDANNDVCAPKAKPVPQPVVAAPAPPPPAPKIGREARTIYFDFNKSHLNPEGIRKLNELVSHIKRSKHIIGAGIAGFADRIGSDDYNLALSKKRAKAVYEYVSERVQINTEILDIRAVGENAPVTDCSKDLKRSKAIQCLARDRRVEVVFQHQE